MAPFLAERSKRLILIGAVTAIVLTVALAVITSEGPLKTRERPEARRFLETNTTCVRNSNSGELNWAGTLSPQEAVAKLLDSRSPDVSLEVAWLSSREDQALVLEKRKGVPYAVFEVRKRLNGPWSVAGTVEYRGSCPTPSNIGSVKSV
jgi:hypothetical protein